MRRGGHIQRMGGRVGEHVREERLCSVWGGVLGSVRGRSVWGVSGIMWRGARAEEHEERVGKDRVGEEHVSL